MHERAKPDKRERETQNETKNPKEKKLQDKQHAQKGGGRYKAERDIRTCKIEKGTRK